VRRLLSVLALACTAIPALAVVTAPPATAATVQVRLHRAIENLPVAAETRAGYDRSKFRHWVDQDGDCRDTRDEVLAAESLVAVKGCDIQVGKWRSYYDGVVTRDSSSFDIDHLVPLAEAWDSGAKRWTARTRQRYANDLGDSRSLVAVTASANRSKGDRDPGDWIPQLGRCHYVRQWVAVKVRWSLKVNPTERRALLARASHCSNTMMTVRRASISKTSSTSNTPRGLDPRFDYCYEAVAAGYGPYRRGIDAEYGWYTDGDSDGVVCES
jgi:hypothetical protein